MNIMNSTFHDFQFEGSFSNKITDTLDILYPSFISHSFGGINAHHVFVEEHVYRCGNNVGLLTTKKFSLNENIYFSNFIIV